MKTLVCSRPGDLEYRSVPEPVLAAANAILRIKRIGICGTDLHAFEGTQPYFNYPRVLGHELAAELVECNYLSGFEIGEPVTIVPYFNCGSCIACRSDKPNCCVHIKVCGVHIDGGMTEYLSVPSYSLVHGSGLNIDELALVEPLAIGAHGIARAGVKEGDHVLVIGAGPIGLGTMEFARIAGAKVIAMDVNADRLQFCKDKLKVDHVVNAVSEDTIGRIRDITGGDMPTVVIDATGSQKAINNGFQYMAHGGKYILIGLQKSEISFSHPEFHKREGTLMSSRNATKADFEQVISAMKNKLIDPLNYITHRIDFSGLKAEFPSLIKPETGVIKAMVSI